MIKSPFIKAKVLPLLISFYILCAFPHSTAAEVITQSHLTNSVTNITGLENYPIIDVHSHTFNARYLPLNNIAMARSLDALPCGIGYLLPQDLVKLVASIIVSNTTLSLTNEANFTQLSIDTKNIAALNLQSEAKQERLRLVQQVIDVKYPAKAGKTASKADYDKTLKKVDKAVLRLLGEAEKNQSKNKRAGPDDELSKIALFRFLFLIRQNEFTLREILTKTEFPQVDLFVHHMMDLGPVYGQDPAGDDFFDFHTSQSKRMEFFDQKSDGKFIHFIAFSPYRARDAHGNVDFEAAWRPVQEALDRGAWGIKFYPPSGYRASRNDIPFRPWYSRILNQQWKARYHGFSDSDLDGIMLKFFERCVERDIPVFAHCNSGEFQAAKNYGLNHAGPEYYLDLLQRNKKLEKLRLCLAHAGGPDFWSGSNSEDLKKWGETVYKLCTNTNYPNIYCEFGVLDEVVPRPGSTNQIYFANQMLASIEKSDGYFARKIMYGSDWFMPIDVDPRALYLKAYQQVFLTPQLRPYYEDFFCKNAVRFLKANEQIKTNALLSAKGKETLRKLIDRSEQQQ